jgi:hypothetical protein
MDHSLWRQHNLTVLGIDGDKVKLGIVAPSSCDSAEELSDRPAWRTSTLFVTAHYLDLQSIEI